MAKDLCAGVSEVSINELTGNDAVSVECLSYLL